MQSIPFVEGSEYRGDPDKSGIQPGSTIITYKNPSQGFEITDVRLLQHSPPYQAPGQALLVTSPVYQTQTSLVYHSVYPLIQTFVSPAPARIAITDPTRYRLIEPQSIHNNAGNEYTWQDSGNRNFNVFSNEENAIYSAMHVDNINGASEVRDGHRFLATLPIENGESRAFKGLRLGDFVYFNFTNQDIFVGGGTGFLLPPNDLYTLYQPVVQMNYATQQPIGSVSVITDETYQRRLLLAQQQNELLRIQNKQNIDSRDVAIDRAKSLQQTNEKLTIASQTQLKLTQDRELKLLSAQIEIKRLRQNEYDRNESERLARNAASKKAFNESEIESSLFRARQEAQAAKDLAAAETARAARAAKDLVAALRKQLDEQAAAKDLAAAELKKALADAAEAPPEDTFNWKQWLSSNKELQNQLAAAQARANAAEQERDAARQRVSVERDPIISIDQWHGPASQDARAACCHA